jgi:hypothetical protein
MNRSILSLSAAILLAACGGTDAAPAADPEPATADEPVAEVAKTDAAPAEAEASQPSADGWMSWGEQFSTHDAIAAKAFFDKTDEYLGKTIKVEGEVAAVCQSMGCWLTFQDEGRTLTVNMKDHGFSVDKKGAGAWCEAEGTVAKVGEELTLTAHAVRMKKTAEAAPTEPAKGDEAEAPSKG